MSDHVLSALKGLGIEGVPGASLEREGAFFALLEGMLVYQDEQGTRRVTLRDLTRIHSDQAGLLRVETPAGTALTASLLGFDPGQVQTFFAGVRDATARAKNLPASPLPTPGGQKTFGSGSKSPPPSSGPSTGGPAPASPRTEDRPISRDVAPRTPAADSPAAPGGQGAVREIRAVTVPAPPVTLSATPAGAAPKPAPGPASPPAAPVPATHVAAAGAGSVLAGLAERAGVVSGLVSRLQFLAVVLGLAAVGLAVFQYLGGQPLQGLWTLIAGGVGCIALLAFADVTRLLVSLARAVAEGGRADERKTDGRGL